MDGDIIFRKVRADARAPDCVEGVYYNLYALETCTVPAFELAHLRTGVAIAFCPADLLPELLPREGPDEVIDLDYRGEICVCFYNQGWADAEIVAGEIIGQIKINKVMT